MVSAYFLPPRWPDCPYCGTPAAFVDGGLIYPHRPDLHSAKFWLCAPCDAYVGCHPGTRVPLGRLAKPALRALKVRVHAALDPLWREGKMSRKQAYRFLAEGLGIDAKKCHVGWFDERRCEAALSFLESRTAVEAK